MTKESNLTARGPHVPDERSPFDALSPSRLEPVPTRELKLFSKLSYGCT